MSLYARVIGQGAGFEWFHMIKKYDRILLDQ